MMQEIQKEITKNLTFAASGYARAGMSLVFGTSGLDRNGQAAIGNLAIATELLLKAFIAKKSLSLLFKNLPLELRCALTTPEAMPKSFRAQPYEIELKSSAYKSLELKEAIAVFSIFFPDVKKRLASHLRFLSEHRNRCVHVVYPVFRAYEIERTAFLFLTLLKHFESEDVDLVSKINWGKKKENDSFFAKFDEKRTENVRKKIDTASEKAKTLKEKKSLEPEDWESYPSECPICGSDGMFFGETVEVPVYDVDEDGFVGSPALVFGPESFECRHCGLKLEDYAEMEIVGLDTDEIDRTEDVDIWYQDHYMDYHDYM